MRAIHKTMLAAIGSVTLAASFSLPAFASTTYHYIQNNGNGEDIIYQDGKLYLEGTIDNKVCYVSASEKYRGHTYYQYRDDHSGMCLQANTADTAVTEGGCDTGSPRQFWWYDGKYLINRAFQTDAYADGSQVDLVAPSLCPTSDSNCTWSIGD
jgi:hypothetical protein